MSVLRVDGWLLGAFQHVYETAWDRMSVPIGSFRMALAIVPVCIDTGLELSRGRHEQTFAGLLLYAIAFCLLYNPVKMVRDDRLQQLGALALLNAEARYWLRRTSSLRNFYIVLTVFSVLMFHHLGSLALIGIAYARCIQVRPRAPTRRSLGGWRDVVATT